MRGRDDVSFLREEVWWLRVVDMRGTSLWKERFDREINPFFGEHEGGRRQGIISSSYDLESSEGGKTSISAMRHYREFRFAVDICGTEQIKDLSKKGRKGAVLLQQINRVGITWNSWHWII